MVCTQYTDDSRSSLPKSTMATATATGTHTHACLCHTAHMKVTALAWLTSLLQLAIAYALPEPTGAHASSHFPAGTAGTPVTARSAPRYSQQQHKPSPTLAFAMQARVQLRRHRRLVVSKALAGGVNGDPMPHPTHSFPQGIEGLINRSTPWISI